MPKNHPKTFSSDGITERLQLVSTDLLGARNADNYRKFQVHGKFHGPLLQVEGGLLHQEKRRADITLSVCSRSRHLSRTTIATSVFEQPRRMHL